MLNRALLSVPRVSPVRVKPARPAVLRATTIESAMTGSAAMKPRYCIVSDLDHTMVDHHDTQFTSLLGFNRLWASKFAHDSLLVFSTGRSLQLYKELRTEAPMLTPDLLICSVGTEIYHTTEQGLELDSEWLAELEKGWDRANITTIVSSFPEFTPQSDSEQRPHKVSYYLDAEDEPGAAVVERLRSKLAAAEIACKVIHSGGRDVDILPACASKGLALQFLQARWKDQDLLPTDGIQVNGDSGNDSELFEAPDVYGCIVGNAMAELNEWADAHPGERIFRATERCAAGIMQTMNHFGKVPDDASLPAAAQARRVLVNLYEFRMAWLAGTVPEDALEAGLGKRLAQDFHMMAADGLMFTRAAFCEDAKKDYARSKGDDGAPTERFWLDQVGASDLGGAWLVTFQVWRQKLGAAQQGPVYHSAVVVPCDSAPEGFAIRHLQGTTPQ